MSNLSNTRSAMIRTVQFRRAGIAAGALLTFFFYGCGERKEAPPVAQPISSKPAAVSVAAREPSPERVAPERQVAATEKVESKLPIYEIQMKREDLGAMDRNFYGQELYPATFVSDGEVFPNVKIRYRGAWARTWPKKPLKIFFNDDKPFKTLHRLNLNSSFRDPSFIRESLAYHIYRACGAPASQSQLVRVQMNGQFRGVYVQVEQPDKEFLKRYNLKGAPMVKAISRMKQSDERDLGSVEVYRRHYEQENQKENDIFPALRDFCHELAQTSDPATFFEKNVDLEKYINYLAATTLCQNWDGYNKNHFLVYDAKGSKKWFLLPWDLDRALGDHWDWSFGRADLPIELGTHADPGVTGWNHLMDRFFSHPELRKRLADRLQQLLEIEFTLQKLGPVIDQMQAAVESEAPLDYRRWPSHGNGMYRDDRVPVAQSIETVKRFIEDRRAFLLAELPRFRARQ